MPSVVDASRMFNNLSHLATPKMSSVDARMFNNLSHSATPSLATTTCKTGAQFCHKLTIVLATSTLALTKEVASGQEWFSKETLPMACSENWDQVPLALSSTTILLLVGRLVIPTKVVSQPLSAALTLNQTLVATSTATAALATTTLNSDKETKA